MFRKYKYFNLWCYKVIPLVYEDSLSYYEVLCKAIDYINNIIKDLTTAGEEIEELKKEVAEIRNILDNFDSEILEEYIAEHLAKMIFVEINNDGYIVYYIPDSWEDITFNTTGLDIIIDGYEDNRLVLSY